MSRQRRFRHGARVALVLQRYVQWFQIELSVVSFQFSVFAVAATGYGQIRVMKASWMALGVPDDLQENGQLKTEN